MSSYKKFLSILLSVVLAFSLYGFSGCTAKNSMELIGKSTKYVLTTPYEGINAPITATYNFLGGKDVMPIGGFFGPYIPHINTVNGVVLPDYFSDKVYSSIADTGINMIVYYNTVNQQTTEKMLSMGDKHGLGLFTKNDAVMKYIENKHANKELTLDVEQLKKDIASYAKHPSFLGLHTRDEPFVRHLEAMKDVTDAFYSLGYENYYSASNALFSVHDKHNVYTEWQTVVDKYDYMQQFVKSSQTKNLSITWYPFENAKDREAEIFALKTHFKVMSQHRKISQDNGVAMWRMLQAGGQWNDAGAWMEDVKAYPSEGEMLWDINVSLAYGAKAIQYFPLIQPIWFAQTEGYAYDFDRNGLIAADGNPTRWFYYAQKANKQIKAIDHVLMNSENIGIIASGSDAEEIVVGGSEGHEIIKEKNFRQLKNVKGDALVGCFDYNGKTALYVVNFSTTNKQNIELQFDNKYGYDIVQRAKSVSVAAKNVNLNLEPGEGTLIVLR